MAIANMLDWKEIASIGIGIGVGMVEFAWHTTAQKVSMLVANLELKPRLEPDEGVQILSCEALEKKFVPMVIQGPILEEVLFRGIAQPALALSLACCFPQLAAPALLGISKASLMSLVATAGVFGYCHISNYENGAPFVMTMATVAGIFFGVAREKFGLVASMAAHMTSNLGTAFLDKYHPSFLEFSWEKELRLLPEIDREKRLLQEAIERIDTAVVKMPQGTDDRVELEQLRFSYLQQMQKLTV